MAVTVLPDARPCDKVEGCSTLIAFRGGARGRPVCLEAVPWQEGDAWPGAQFYYLDDEGVPHRVATGHLPKMGVPLFVCHTSRPGHGHLSRAGAIDYETYIASPRWKKFAEDAIANVNYTCEGCAAQNVPLHVHHPDYSKLGRETFDDVAVLCDLCHDQEPR